MGREAMMAPLLLLATCGWWSGAGPGCQVTSGPMAISPEIDETSGVAVSRTHTGVIWTHNDGRRPFLYAVDSRGRLLGRTEIPGLRLRDWEDLEISECGEGSCLYLADVGDNDEERERIVVYRVPEPEPGAERTGVAQAYPIVLPDGPRDIEALFVLPGERLFLVTKGRNHPLTLYRYPGTPREGPPVEMVEVQTFSDQAVSLPRMVTGASGSPDGRTVAIRSYESVTFYRVGEEEETRGVPDAGPADSIGAGAGRADSGASGAAPGSRAPFLVPLDSGTVNLRLLQEPQGEAVGLGADGLVVLTSEDGPGGAPPSMALMRCDLGR